jgi:hypothetical protein
MDTVFFFLDRTGLTVDSMKTVSKTINGQLLNVPAAANDDRLDDARPRDRGIEATGAWDSYDVWRRFIKEARERRGKIEPKAN